MERENAESGAAPQPQAWEAFSSSVVTENFGKRILALDVWGELLLAGLVDGTLVVFAPAQPPADPGGPWQVRGRPKALKALKYLDD